MPLAILLVDDDDDFRNAERRLLDTDGAFEVVGEAANGEDAIRLARALHPDVVVMDIGMPQVNGLEAACRIKAVQPEIRIVIVTVYDTEGYRRIAANYGVDAYVVKKRVRDELTAAVRKAGRRERGDPGP